MELDKRVRNVSLSKSELSDHRFPSDKKLQCQLLGSRSRILWSLMGPWKSWCITAYSWVLVVSFCECGSLERISHFISRSQLCQGKCSYLGPGVPLKLGPSGGWVVCWKKVPSVASVVLATILVMRWLLGSSGGFKWRTYWRIRSRTRKLPAVLFYVLPVSCSSSP